MTLRCLTLLLRAVTRRGEPLTGALTMPGHLAAIATDPVAVIDDCLPRNELGEPWHLLAHQPTIFDAAFRFDAQGAGSERSPATACCGAAGGRRGRRDHTER